MNGGIVALVRLEAGAELAQHSQEFSEQIYVMNGILQCGRTYSHAGECIDAPAGAEAQTMHSRGECIVMLIGSHRLSGD